MNIANKLLKFIYNIAFGIRLCLSWLLKGLLYMLAKTFLIIQPLKFKLSKYTLSQIHKYRLKKIDDEHTRQHLKELADLLDKELNKYRQDIGKQNFYKLKIYIWRSLNNMQLASLTKLYNILFETTENLIPQELNKFVNNVK
ncbi:MAG: hypothetical protein WBB28_18780 [Crinalium sp.]